MGRLTLMTRIKQRWCSHAFDSRAIRRVEPDRVESKCLRCGKVCSAPYGIVLPGRLL